MIVYVVESKIPEQDVEKLRIAKSSLAEARKKFNDRVNEIKESGERGWCDLKKIELSNRLTNKQLIIAIMSDRGFADNQQYIETWSNNTVGEKISQ